MNSHTNKHFCAFIKAICFVLVVGFTPAVFAQADFVPYVSAVHERNSNIFSVPDSRAVLAPDGQPTLDDTLMRYAGGLDLSYDWGGQKVYLGAETGRVEYGTFTQFDHTDYAYTAGADWALANRLDGKINFRQSRTTESFADIDVFQLVLNKRKVATASIDLDIGSRWHLETSYDYNDLSAPTAALPEYGQEEWSATAGIKYAGLTGFDIGLQSRYQESEILGIPNQTKLKTNAILAVLNYAVDPRLTFNAAGGVTKQSSEAAIEAFSAATWQVGINRKLTAKTSVDLQVFRAINTYLAAGSSQIDTGAKGAITWQATGKTGLTASYLQQTSKFKQPFLLGVVTDRKDDDSIATIELNYQVLRWLKLQPYWRKQKRDSEETRLSYATNVAGINLTARFE